MAQNNYGLKIISWSCYLFSLTFLLELILRFGKMNIWKKLEQVTLTVFVALFGLRAAYIHFQYVEWLVVFVAFVLAISYVRFLLENVKSIRHSNSFMARAVGIHYVTVIAFLISVALRPVSALSSQLIGGIGGLCLGLVVISVLFRNSQIIDGQEVKILRFIRDRDDHSSWLVTGFLLIGMYVGLNFLGILPTLYTDEVPQAYIELVNQAETGRAKAIDGRYQHDLYKEELDRFLENYNTEN